MYEIWDLEIEVINHWIGLFLHDAVEFMFNIDFRYSIIETESNLLYQLQILFGKK